MAMVTAPEMMLPAKDGDSGSAQLLRYRVIAMVSTHVNIRN